MEKDIREGGQHLGEEGHGATLYSNGSYENSSFFKVAKIKFSLPHNLCHVD